ncbi:extracellular superoxide dismutase [Cu-Zn]-like isoform X7 [Myxocyprinus asiaticus]|uniref:extracellular superoxide dismutase [Cu-Zn]-like isoform X4 n=1 Tax=Myxocyprinus asiaticus TaxID=70543 RepID=UPI0022217107|nr:extracellular superoxide dismutase [Cu-Zn]-like isoform X4 [Myxocyprinus asiaticus]XP_051551051.1 extracellular superoxide dismutase [Cu-Zn]-like isoform X7 [Myxocyprinus asiaticus]XP_051551683.1 extracellular superoxide dismutase [Cu-Zn]-like isoform X7 [Myxocyprinus asiaticus]
MEKIVLKLPLVLLALQIQSGKLMSPDNPLVLIIDAPTPEIVEFNNTIYAICEVTPIPNLPTGQPEIFGQVLFKQVFPNGTLQVIINLRGLPTDDHQARAIHIHQFGDFSQGCDSTGPHYNPKGVDHPGHPGDFGNFVSKQGIIRHFLELPEGKLFGSQSILGRAVVVHEKEDDLGMGSDEESKLSGNAGKRIAGCVIGISSPCLWQIAVEEDTESQR